MTQNSRRALLKGLAVTLPAAWSRPIVESVVLPAHAQTSEGCSADAGCYSYTSGERGLSFNWPGGGGARTLDIIDGRSCDDNTEFTASVVLAASGAEAESLATCDGSGEVLVQVATEPPAPDGCNFFVCTVIN
jgi:hypothetical protein